MCTGGEILAVGSALAGTYLQQQAADDAAQQQQKIINQAAEENSRLQAKKADTITDFAKDTFDPTTRDQSYESAATKNESALKDALLSAQGGEGQVYQGTEGNLSGDYDRAKAASTAKAGQDIMNRAKLLARSNAAGLMYNNEATKGSVLASDLMGINAAGTRNNSAAQAGVGSVRNNGSVLGGILVGGANAAGKKYDSMMWGGV
jgi:hypothetical protein